jgi:hypothetical protein
MNTYGTDAPEVLDALRESLDGVTMGTPVEQIVAAGRARRNRRRLVGAAAGAVLVAAAGVTAGLTTGAQTRTPADGVWHVQTVAYTVTRNANGTVDVTWDKRRYFDNREGLQSALRAAGFPVLIKVGEFCVGPNDDATLDPSGTGPGVERVMTGETAPDGKVTFTFVPAAMPAGKQLFIGYLSPSQLAVTHGAPASVERLISTGVPLTCTTVAPPPNGKTGGKKTDKTKHP